LLAKNARTTRAFRQHALSLTSIASKLAPTEEQSKSRAAYPHALHHSSGRALARLQLLILIHPPPRKAEWRCSSGGRRAAPFDEVEHIERRSSRSRPEAMRPDEYRSEGTPSLSKGPQGRNHKPPLPQQRICTRPTKDRSARRPPRLLTDQSSNRNSGQIGDVPRFCDSRMARHNEHSRWS
jgi:hypothetical protein